MASLSVCPEGLSSRVVQLFVGTELRSLSGGEGSLLRLVCLRGTLHPQGGLPPHARLPPPTPLALLLRKSTQVSLASFYFGLKVALRRPYALSKASPCCMWFTYSKCTVFATNRYLLTSIGLQPGPPGSLPLFPKYFLLLGLPVDLIEQEVASRSSCALSQRNSAGTHESHLAWVFYTKGYFSFLHYYPILILGLGWYLHIPFVVGIFV